MRSTSAISYEKINTAENVRLCTQCLKLLVHGAHKDVLFKFKEATELFTIAILGSYFGHKNHVYTRILLDKGFKQVMNKLTLHTRKLLTTKIGEILKLPREVRF